MLEVVVEVVGSVLLLVRLVFEERSESLVGPPTVRIALYQGHRAFSTSKSLEKQFGRT